MSFIYELNGLLEIIVLLDFGETNGLSTLKSLMQCPLNKGNKDLLVRNVFTLSS